VAQIIAIPPCADYHFTYMDVLARLYEMSLDERENLRRASLLFPPAVVNNVKEAIYLIKADRLCYQIPEK
jgi:hypothetical protein